MQQATMLRKETKIMLPGNVNYEAQSAELIYSLFMHTQQQKMFFEYVCWSLVTVGRVKNIITFHFFIHISQTAHTWKLLSFVSSPASLYFTINVRDSVFTDVQYSGWYLGVSRLEQLHKYSRVGLFHNTT